MKTILVADEDTSVRNLVRLTFTEHMGYNVVAASNGADAILKATEIEPDVVLVDVSLSNHNGYSVSREIKNDPLLNDAYVILLGPGFEPFDEKKVFAARADDIITKPFEPEELTKKVLGHFEKKGIGQTSSSKKGKVDNKSITLSETAGIRASERRSDYIKPLASFSHPVVNGIKNFYLSSKAYAENLKLHVEKLKTVTSKLTIKGDFFKISLANFIETYSPLFKQWSGEGSFKFSLTRTFKTFPCRFGTGIGGIRRAVRIYAKRFKAVTCKLNGKITSPVPLISKGNLRNNLRRFYGVPGSYYKRAELSISSLRERWIPYATLHAKSFKFLSPHFDRKYFFVSALGIVTILLITIPIVFADKRERRAPSSSLPSAFILPGLKSSPKVVVAHNSASEDALNGNILSKVPKEKIQSFVRDDNIIKEEFQGVWVKEKKGQSLSPIQAQKKGDTRAGKYVVRRGDTLWGIANKFNVSLEALRVVNDIWTDKIYVGRVLTIPQGVIRKEVIRWDIIGTTTHPGGIKIIDWSFYMPWSGVAVIHHVSIENTSNKSYKDIKVRILYYSSSDDNRTKRGEIIATLPIFVPRNSKRTYLEDGFPIRGDFNTNGMRVTKGNIEVIKAAALGNTRSYSSR